MKGGIALVSRILGESEAHTSQHEPLPAIPPDIQTRQTFLFPSFVKYQGVFSAAGDMTVYPKERGSSHEVAMRKAVGEGGLGVGETEE